MATKDTKDKEKKTKKSNYTELEKNILVREYLENRDRLESEDFADTEKHEIWLEINKKVNDAHKDSKKRTVQEIKEKIRFEKKAAMAVIDYIEGSKRGREWSSADPIMYQIIDAYKPKETFVVTSTTDDLDNSSVKKETKREEVAGTSDRVQETTTTKSTCESVEVKDLQAEKKKYLAAKTEMVTQQTKLYKEMLAVLMTKK